MSSSLTHSQQITFCKIIVEHEGGCQGTTFRRMFNLPSTLRGNPFCDKICPIKKDNCDMPGALKRAKSFLEINEQDKDNVI